MTVTESEDAVSGYLCLRLVRQCREPSKGIVRVGWTNSIPARGKDDLEIFGPIEDSKQAAVHLRQAMKGKFELSTSPGMSGGSYFFGGLQDIADFFHMFCYYRLQVEHMQWMAIPMELD